MILSARTDLGKVRQHNEDSYRVKIFSDSLAYGIVCDGMGGVNGGKVASQTAIEVIAEIFDQYFSKNKPPFDIPSLLRKSIRCANDEIYKMSKADVLLSGMGTTVVIAIVVNKDLYIANVGDSRAYLVYDTGVQQLSVDHSAVQELVDSGKISKDEARIHPKKNIITRALGVDSMVNFDFFTYEFIAGDRILLCSDGLSNYCTEDTIFDFFSKNYSLTELTEQLIRYANEQGGHDNITALVIQQDR